MHKCRITSLENFKQEGYRYVFPFKRIFIRRKMLRFNTLRSYSNVSTGATATWHGSFATEHRDSEQLQSELHVESAIQ